MRAKSLILPDLLSWRGGTGGGVSDLNLFLCLGFFSRLFLLNHIQCQHLKSKHVSFVPL